MLISFAVTAKLICVFVFANAKSRFSHEEAHKFWYMYSDLNRSASRENLSSVFPTSSDINCVVKQQKMATGSKFWI